jgi:L-alanine-DL-glutamate epimerase-like enolase superfamily enzyme
MLESTYSDQHAFPPFLGLETSYNSPIIVKSIELLRYAGTYLVRSISEDGATGISVCNSRARYLFPMLKELVIPAFVGRDVRELESLVNEVYIFRSNYKYQGTPFWNCVAYVEASLFDLLGKVTNRSVGDLVGEVWRDEIPIYLSSMERDTTPEEEVDWLSKRLSETNARAIKMKIGGRMRNNVDSLPGRTEKLIPLARKTFGDDVTLYVDANGSYDHRKAIEMGRILADNAYSFFEEPCPFEQYEETKAVADALDMDVAGGEQDCNLGHFKVMIRERIVNVVQPDLMYNGGLIRALRVARMAAEAGIKVTPHSPKHNPELCTLLHFASVVRNTGPFMEFPAVAVKYDSWYDPPFVLQEGGKIKVPTGPGLGVSYDESIWKQAEKV